MVRYRFVFAVLSIALTNFVSDAATPKGGRVLDGKLHHIGIKEMEFWKDVPTKPEAPKLNIRFKSQKNEKPYTISITYRDVNAPATLEVNGEKVHTFPFSQNRRVAYAEIPAGKLKTGNNVLTFTPGPEDDCAVGNVILFEEPFSEVMRLQPVVLSVTDKSANSAVPARITITDKKGVLQQIFFAPTNTAVRAGLIYMDGKPTTIQLSEGEYVVSATRGMEWSRDRREVTVKKGEPMRLDLAIRREVDTSGFVATDTHLHNVTFSGHGDANIYERMLTLAGEGVEMAIATDHNHHTDYRPYQQALNLNEYFTPVVGNEVTTKIGHLNGFPMPLNGPIPNFRDTNWVTLVPEIRAKGAKVVILNHPRWPRIKVFDDNGLNPLTGARASGMPFTVNGVELANSGSLVRNPMTLFTDWFGLLNYGEKLTAVGSSDSHNVDTPVGQGRTYIRSSTDTASKVNIDEACNNFLAGDTSISLGIFADVRVDGHHMGEVVPVKNEKVKVQLRVAAPSWVKPERALLFVNGRQVAEQPVKTTKDRPTNRQITFSVPAPRVDSHIVCVVLGDGITDPSWPTEADYTLAATNPVFLDANNDAVYDSPRKTAQALLARTPGKFSNQWKLVSQSEDAVAIQILSLLVENQQDRTKWLSKLEQVSNERKIYSEFLKSYRTPSKT